MTFIFTLITGTIDFCATIDVPFDATSLLDAAKQLKRYLSFVRGDILIVVSYNYIVIFDDGVMHERCMSDMFYDKYILEVEEDV